MSIPEAAAWHEAGHAVMRWRLALPLTKLIVNADGSGFCWGTGRPLITLRDSLRLRLAGPAGEIGMMSALLSWEESRGADLDAARVILARWTPPAEIEDGLKREFDAVCDDLWPHFDLVELIA